MVSLSLDGHSVPPERPALQIATAAGSECKNLPDFLHSVRL